VASLEVLSRVKRSWKKGRHRVKSCQAKQFKSWGKGVYLRDDHSCSSLSIIVVTDEGAGPKDNGLVVFEITDPKLVNKLLPALA